MIQGGMEVCFLLEMEYSNVHRYSISCKGEKPKCTTLLLEFCLSEIEFVLRCFWKVEVVEHIQQYVFYAFHSNQLLIRVCMYTYVPT